MEPESHPQRFSSVDQLITEALIPQGVVDQNVLTAIRRVPRGVFMPDDAHDMQWDNHAVGIGFEQTISQPLIVGLMLQALNVHPHHKALEIGTGMGYQAALLSVLARRVITVERISELAAKAETNLLKLDFINAKVVTGDGAMGYAAEAPYDRIIVACACSEEPQALTEQLKIGGRLIAPIGDRAGQRLTLIQKTSDGFLRQRLDPCVFVPLIGEGGWEYDEG